MIEKLKQHKNEVTLIVLTVLVFALFFYITRLTPLAGDDWGYAVQGREGNPFVLAMNFYSSWSGRFFSELWGFIVAPNKWLWNILNPLMFAGLFYGVYKLINPQKNQILIMFVELGLMLSVDQVLRIETYTWIMGSTYVVPLLLTVVYLNIIKPCLTGDKELTMPKLIGSIVLNLYIGLCMENIAAVLILGNLLMLLYTWFNNKALFKKIVFITLASIISFAILRLSPGSTTRLYRDNQGWLSMSLLQQIGSNWNNFLTYTFTNNIYVLLSLSVVLLIGNYNLWVNKQCNKPMNIALIVMNAICLLAAMAPKLFEITNLNFLRVLYDHTYSRAAYGFCTAFYLLYIVAVFFELYYLLPKKDAKDTKYYEGIFYLMLAGTGNLVMLVSPIFGARSSLYTVYFLIILICYALSYLECSKPLIISGIIIYGFLILSKVREFDYKYTAVHNTQIVRDGQIAYYVDHPEEEEAWLIRMPKGYIHSADIEEGDDYHMDAFKAYYGINPDMHLVFYSE